MLEPAVKPVTIVSETTPVKPIQPLLKPLEPTKKGFPLKTVLIILIIIVAGIASGYGLNTVSGGGSGGLKSTEEVSQTGVKVGDVVGSSDEKSFRDQAEGVLARGGINGEGSHHLLRPGGPSQNVYLTSSVVDLELFVDHQIQVWGETFSAQTAGWLMDVGRVTVLELNAAKPFEESPAPATEE